MRLDQIISRDLGKLLDTDLKGTALPVVAAVVQSTLAWLNNNTGDALAKKLADGEASLEDDLWDLCERCGELGYELAHTEESVPFCQPCLAEAAEYGVAVTERDDEAPPL